MSDHLLENIRQAETFSKKLDPILEIKELWGKASLEHVLNFSESLAESPAFINNPNQAKKLLEFPFQEIGISMEKALEIITSQLDEQGLKASGGRHLGYVPGGGVYPSGLGDLIAAVCNYYAGVFYVSPGAVRMENMIIRWVAEMIGYDPGTCQGNISSGGSYSSLIAMHAAREALGIRARDVEKAVIYLTKQTHHALTKSLRVIGMGDAIYKIVPMDKQFRMDAQVLEQMIENDIAAGFRPAILIGSAGTTDVGAIDPLEQLADISGKYGLWFHVDAAYGGFFMLVDEMKKAFSGIERSDSMVIDPHKGLFMPWGTGMVLLKDGKKLLQAFHSYASYLQDLIEDEQEYSPADLSPELTKHFRGLRIWLPLQLFGVKSFRMALREKRLLAEYVYQKLKDMAGFEVGEPPQLTVVTFRYTDCQEDVNHFNEKLIKAIQQDGRIFLSSTLLEGKFYLRFTVLHFRTHLREVNTCFEVIEEQVKKLQGFS